MRRAGRAEGGGRRARLLQVIGTAHVSKRVRRVRVEGGEYRERGLAAFGGVYKLTDVSVDG